VVVLARDEVQRAAQEPGDDERAVVGERAVDLARPRGRAPRPEREPCRAQVLRLHCEQVRHGGMRRRGRVRGEQLRRSAPATQLGRPHSATSTR
jgi:hypothetical protein